MVPCFNEAARFNLGYWTEIVESIPNSIFIFVNDGSTDETGRILNSIEKSNVVSLNLPKNLGKEEAIRFGLNYALSSFNPDYLGFLDSDGAFSPTDIRNIVSIANSKFIQPSKLTCLIASRVALSGRNIERSKLRHYLGRIIVSYVCLGWNNPPYDTQSGFKIFLRNSDFTEAVTTKFVTRWFFDIEILLRISRTHMERVWEIPLENWQEIGKSKINSREFVRVIREIIVIRKLVKSSNSGSVSL